LFELARTAVSGSTAPDVLSALQDAQRLGFLGSRPIPEVIAHARGFVAALRQHGPIETVLDLGAGGGTPGFVIAHDLPDVRLTLLDRRAKRTDFLERVVRRLGWQDRVSVVCRDADEYAPDSLFDAVVARGFGPPTFTLTTAARFVRRGQPIVISEPPGNDRWDGELLDRLQLRRCDDPTTPLPTAAPTQLDGLVAVFTRS
jgi:16S rRNA (guanine527-N7)-methyltransferase